MSARIAAVLSGLVLLVATLAAGRACFGFAMDDAYIIYRYSYNFATGHGLVFNPGEWHQGSTGMFYALLLGIAGWAFGPDNIPRLAEVFSTLGIGMTALGLYALFRAQGRGAGGLAAGLVYIFSGSVVPAFGFETLVQLPCAVWAYYFYEREARAPGVAWKTVTLLAFAALLRPDGVVWALPILAHAVYTRSREGEEWHWRKGLTSTAREAVLFLLLMLPFAALSLVYYRGILPGTLAAKMAQTLSGWFPPFVKGGIQWFLVDRLEGEPWQSYVYLVALAGLFFLHRHRSALRLCLGAALYLLVYAVLNVPSYPWYFTPADLLLAVLVGVAVSEVLARLSRRPVAAVAGGILLAAIGWQFGRYRLAADVHLHDDNLKLPKFRDYAGLGKVLAESFAPGSTVGYCEVGYLGWASRGRLGIVDQLMLVTPGDYSAIGRKVVDSAFRQHRPTIIVEAPNLLGTNRGHTWFRQNYDYWRTFPLAIRAGATSPMTWSESVALAKQGFTPMDIWVKRQTPRSKEETMRLVALDNKARPTYTAPPRS